VTHCLNSDDYLADRWSELFCAVLYAITVDSHKDTHMNISYKWTRVRWFRFRFCVFVFCTFLTMVSFFQGLFLCSWLRRKTRCRDDPLATLNSIAHSYQQFSQVNNLSFGLGLCFFLFLNQGQTLQLSFVCARFSVCSLGCCAFGCQYQCIQLPEKTCVWNNLFCVRF